MPHQMIMQSYSDGPTKTANAIATVLPSYCAVTLPAGYWQIGRMWRMVATGRISCVISTPGTCRLSLLLGAVVAFDTLAIPLNIIAKTDEAWYLEVLLTCRAVGSGTSANLIGQGKFLSEACIATVVAATGPGPGGVLVPFDTAPVVGTGFDSTAALTVGFQHTQTASTGSFTVHQFLIEQLNP